MRGILLVAAVALAGCAPSVQDVKPRLAESDAGTVWFATPGSIARDPKSGSLSLSSEPVVLSGELQFPPGRGPFPAVVLAHGCGGPGNAEAGWAPVLREWGYATLVMDSFRGRNLQEVCTEARKLIASQRVPDAYGALRILATHPKVDGRRVALMGFSHGGIVTVASATAWARDRYLQPGAPGFRAFVAFYPYCNATYPELDLLGGPLRIHSGVLDDWTPAAPCEKVVARMRLRRQDASITIYAGAHHSFDNIGVPVRYLPNVENGAKCVRSAPFILGPYSGTPLAECVKRGATIGMNDAAIAEARRNVRRQLAELLK